ncbi:hypothetical protein DY000_02023134 [Brassica cretica]|uniref:Uncharacterized protein n=1 Tax=Brassica cretica TaxID=69181 RepID=A0ABQ7EAP0_BRACR|nr:hypothetical protein DY000_02023134 [Brassica cretica]
MLERQEGGCEVGAEFVLIDLGVINDWYWNASKAGVTVCSGWLVGNPAVSLCSWSCGDERMGKGEDNKDEAYGWTGGQLALRQYATQAPDQFNKHNYASEETEKDSWSVVGCASTEPTNTSYPITTHTPHVHCPANINLSNHSRDILSVLASMKTESFQDVTVCHRVYCPEMYLPRHNCTVTGTQGVHYCGFPIAMKAWMGTSESLPSHVCRTSVC